MEQHIVVDLEAGTQPGEQVPIVFTGTSVTECENWIADEEKRNPDKVHRGGYGID